MMSVENRVKNSDDERNRSLGKMLQRPVWNIVSFRSPAELKIPDGFVNLVRVD
jgi:hypothetical protein